MSTTDSLGSGAAVVISATRQYLGPAGGTGALGISLGGPSDWKGDGQRHLQFGARMENVEGTPGPPSIALTSPGFWRFRWVVGVGNRSVTVFTKQAANMAGFRPTVVLKANPATGLNADVTATAGLSVTWTSITASFGCTGVGVIWVELHSNCGAGPYPPDCICYFDRISVV